MQDPSSQSHAQGWAVRRGDRRYEARWYDHQRKRRSKSGFTRKRDAETYAKARASEVTKVWAGNVLPDRPESIGALLDEFLAKHGRTIDPATLKKLTTQLRHARQVFGHRSPETLRKAEMEDWRLDLPAGSRHDVFRAFRQALGWASDPDRGLLERNPTNGIKNPKRKRHERREVFPFEGWNEIDALANELNSRYAAIPIVAVGTGLRPEELFGLHRADVDYDDANQRGRLHVRRRYTQGLLKEGTKTGGERHVPFGSRVYDALKSMPPRIDTPILFPAPRGGYIDIEKLRHCEWAPGLRTAGLAHHRIYDLRHTYASWSLAADPPVPVAKLAKMMGTSISQIEDTYRRFLRGDEERYATALDTYGSVVGQ